MYYYYNLILFYIYSFLIKVVLPFSPEYNNLILWIQKNQGYINEKVIPDETSKFNRIILAKKNIAKNELISFIPEKIILSSINPLLN